LHRLSSSKVNKLTVKDAFPLPNIESCLDTLGENLYMSTFDMAASYWQLEIDEQDTRQHLSQNMVSSNMLN
jgi:hypothetical protein